MDGSPLRPVDAAAQRDAMTRRLHRRSIVNGQITLPAVPGMIDQYMSMCENLFATLGRPFNAEQLAHVREVLEGQLAEAYANSPRSNIVISYDAPVGTMLNYHVKAEWWTVEGAYENWISTREPPLFGTEPDARVLALANRALDPRASRVLDIGGGTGRNTLALARRGHPVDVVTGYVVDTATDISLPGMIPFEWTRTYSSARRTDKNAALGQGWAHGFEQQITEEEHVITLRGAEGRSIWFGKIKPGESTFHRRERMTLHRDGEDDYRVEKLDGRLTYVFGAAKKGGPALLRAIKDAWENTVQYTVTGKQFKLWSFGPDGVSGTADDIVYKRN